MTTIDAPRRARAAAPMAITAKGLRLSYGDHVVLDGVDLDVGEGTVVALLGPNGAGKTTVVHLLCTLLRPDAGTATVGGCDLLTDPPGVRRAIGVTGQFAAVDALLTGAENLQLMADLFHLGRKEGRARVAELLEQFDLSDAADRLVSTYSGGMTRRLDLAMTLVGEPRIIFLDEPTTGLDPRSRRTMWQIIRELVADGVTVLLTTQYLDEADQLADRVVVLDQGHVVAEGTPSELKRRVPGGHLRLRFTDEDDYLRAARTLHDADTDPDELVVQLPGDGGVDGIRVLLDRLDRLGVEPAELSIHTPDLDDVFLALTGRTETQEAHR